MAELNVKKTRRVRKIRHRGRGSQVPIYLGKQLRFFVNQSDWKVLPMAAIIAALVSMVIRKDFFLTMEGNLKGAFALTCVGIWNGCFNSIQSVCRERPIIKREHRSGMHISSYIVAHMIYQFALCAAQTGLSMYVLKMMGIHFPETGFITPWMIVDLGITLLLISYAADMMSLLISSVSHTTTGAMTVMPFVLIFQLVFSGGLLPLPDWTKPLSNFTISNYGIKAIASQSGYNEAPMVTAWKTVDKMRNNELGGAVTLGQIMDLLDSPAVEKRRDTEVMKSFTVGEVADILSHAEETLHLRAKELTHPVSVGQLIDIILTENAFQEARDLVILPATEEKAAVTVADVLNVVKTDESTQALLTREIGTTITLGQVLDALHAGELAEKYQDQQLNEPVTLGQIVDFLKNNAILQNQRDREFTFKTSVGDLLELFGEENVKQLIQEKTAAASHNADYERSMENIVGNWIMLFLFVLVFASLATIILEFIDKDKR
ncbi:MAG: ABC transporter permease [Clostridia bacterium]|nr:ABC transporter permease [Clostridia bacterium]